MTRTDPRSRSRTRPNSSRVRTTGRRRETIALTTSCTRDQGYPQDIAVEEQELAQGLVLRGRAYHALHREGAQKRRDLRIQATYDCSVPGLKCRVRIASRTWSSSRGFSAAGADEERSPPPFGDDGIVSSLQVNDRGRRHRCPGFTAYLMGKRGFERKFGSGKGESPGKTGGWVTADPAGLMAQGNRLCRDFNIGGTAGSGRNFLSRIAKAFDVKFDGAAHLFFALPARSSCSDAPRKIRRVSTESRFASLDND